MDTAADMGMSSGVQPVGWFPVHPNDDEDGHDEVNQLMMMLMMM